MAEISVFVGTLAVAYLVPGPDMILLLQTGARRGRRHAIAAAAGLSVARAIHVTFAACGLAALVRTSPQAFDAVRLAGAAYLCWLGVSVLRAHSLLLHASEAREAIAPVSLGVIAMRGLLTNLLNPKALLFCSVLLPQFLRPQEGPLYAQFVFLGAVLIVTGIVFDVQYAWVGDRIGAFLAPRPFWQHLQRWVFGSLLIGFGVRLALAERV